MIVTGLVLNGIITKQTIENKILKEKISRLETETNEKINELTVTVINNKYSTDQEIQEVSQELGEIKATANDDFSGIIENSIDSIVSIRTLTMQGSGFFIDENGYIATNMHVVNSPTGISNIIQILTEDNKIHYAKTIGYIEKLDLALIQINATYPRLNLEEKSNIQTGEPVIAIGSPEGFHFSATDGIISGINRIGFNNIGSYIQTNAELNQGNSGGPLINKQGKVVGMNNFKLVDSEGIGFALDSEKLKEGINEISMIAFNKSIIN